jgi:VanZ family protein
MTVTLLQSSTRPLVGPARPLQEDPLWDALLVVAHLVGFGGLTALLIWALRVTLPVRRSVWITLVFVCIYSLLTELLQSLVPDRSLSLLDVGTNLLAAGVVTIWVWRRESLFSPN